MRAAPLVLLVACLAMPGCSEVEEASSDAYEPAKLEAVEGSESKRVTFTEEGARRTGLETAPVRRSGARRVVPYEALIYDGAGTSYVYSSPKPLTYLRTKVDVERIDGDRVLLSGGPAAGTDVVTVGATEVYGTELEIAGGH